LPARAVDRLFARFVAMYGLGAMQRMWGDSPTEDVKGVWADSLGRFSLDEILGGLRALEDAGLAFPPTRSPARSPRSKAWAAASI
jgi:hypothetical protein